MANTDLRVAKSNISGASRGGLAGSIETIIPLTMKPMSVNFLILHISDGLFSL